MEALGEIIKETAAKFNITPSLIFGLVAVESGFNPFSFRYEPAYTYLYNPSEMASLLGLSLVTEVTGQKCSWGLLQVMGAVARQYGFRGYLTELSLPEKGLEFGARLLLSLQGRYSDLKDQISAYNQGTAKKDLAGRYLNADYVEKVLTNMEKWSRGNLQ